MNISLDYLAIKQNGIGGQDPKMEARRKASVKFFKQVQQAKKAMPWAKLMGRNPNLREMASGSENKSTPRTTRTISISLDKIVGSEGRSDDFDAEFRPLKTYNRDRWVGIAAARRMGIALPPVELVQVNGEYYVRDGHHRISVAKAMGQLSIEAVIVN